MDMESSSHDAKPTEKIWRGTSISDICKARGHWSFAMSPVAPSKYHCVLYKIPVTLQGPPRPHHNSQPKYWDEDHVRMPYSDKNLFPVKEDGADVITQRWKIITDVLSQPILSSFELESAINQYNSSLPKFSALQYFFEEVLEQEETDHFFKNILPKIITLALKLPEIIPAGIPLLKQNYNRTLSMSQLQIACLLCNAFLCTFPWRKNVARTFPGVNFVGLFSAHSRPTRQNSVAEKLKCICNYFRRITQNNPIGVLTFERKMISRKDMPRWDELDNNLGNTRIHITSLGTIEDDGLGFLQVDFANKNIGGGVLGYGCVQEEIRFVICPELLVSRLFVEQLGNGEAVIITGAERYNDYLGYADGFEWKCSCQDDTPFDTYGRRKTTICVIDATKFNKPQDQFQSSFILRELNKAYVGFSTREKENVAPVATGNWGCGAFHGSKGLKTLIQLMACSATGRDLVYYSFGDQDLVDNFYELYLFLASNQITIKQLWRFLRQFSAADLKEDKLFSYIQQAYFDSKKQPTINKYFFKQTDNDTEKEHATSSTSKEKIATPSLSQSFISTKKSKMDDEVMDTLDESPSSEDIIPSSQPTERNFKRIVKLKPKKAPQDIVKKLPQTDISKIFDMLDGNANQSKHKEQEKEDQHQEDSLLSVFDKISKSDKGSTSLEEIVVVKDIKMEVDETVKQSQQKSSMTKITDYFARTSK